ncbi:MAG: sel1 repeat family protein [Pedosphaera sp.]|nr:sel1 repeat family protein [Pedosphaera sp.]
MKTIPLRTRIVLPSLTLFLLVVAAGCGKKTETASTGDEISALRQEVAALREEVAALRGRPGVKVRGQSATGAEVSNFPAASDSWQETVAALREELATSRRQLATNLTQIAVDRGGDAWRRGDFKESMKLLKPLAEDGHPIAQHRVAVMHVLGQGVPKDAAEAIKWFGKAAEQGQGESQHSLGLRYLWGDGVEKNSETAAAWFNAAANQGIPDAATWLADSYWTGSGVQQDVVEGYKWLLLAGDKFSINHRNGVTMEQFAAQLTPQQKAEAEQRARDFVPKRTGPEDF